MLYRFSVSTLGMVETPCTRCLTLKLFCDTKSELTRFCRTAKTTRHPFTPITSGHCCTSLPSCSAKFVKTSPLSPSNSHCITLSLSINLANRCGVHSSIELSPNLTQFSISKLFRPSNILSANTFCAFMSIPSFISASTPTLALFSGSACGCESVCNCTCILELSESYSNSSNWYCVICVNLHSTICGDSTSSNTCEFSVPLNWARYINASSTHATILYFAAIPNTEYNPESAARNA
ncbi:hypothetical protein AX774_g3919 [Zancudomyces culisetae]|uniref:Uncharacterized protein n=1 Tax=Zancudomyces culisetae TaxID=1213189 RepID=A0A1R1PNQ5_ZANCU|nr:hypothetical protein AX774_g3919 [Zancudomyces culisetae]|eukprot:OMH82599.1 hypothetical protein AX774_g3919 [Zancudomyces culisetae]